MPHHGVYLDRNAAADGVGLGHGVHPVVAHEVQNERVDVGAPRVASPCGRDVEGDGEAARVRQRRGGVSQMEQGPERRCRGGGARRVTGRRAGEGQRVELRGHVVQWCDDLGGRQEATMSATVVGRWVVSLHRLLHGLRRPWDRRERGRRGQRAARDSVAGQRRDNGEGGAARWRVRWGGSREHERTRTGTSVGG